MKLIYFGWAVVVFSFAAMVTFSDQDDFKKIKALGHYVETIEQMPTEQVVNQPFVPLSKSSAPQLNKSIWVKLGPFSPEDAGDFVFLSSSEVLLGVKAVLQSGSELRELGDCDLRGESDNCEQVNLQYAFKLPKKINESSFVYLKAKVGGYGFQNDIYLLRPSYFKRAIAFLNYFLGFSTGIGTLIVGLAVLFWFLTKQYVFLVFAVCAFLSNLSPFVYRGVWDIMRPGFISLDGSQLFLPIFYLARCSEVVFMREFFRSSTNKTVDGTLLAIVLFYITMFAAQYVGGLQEMHWILFPQIVFYGPLIILAVMLYFVATKKTMAMPYLLAWSTGLIGFATWGAFRMNLLPDHWIFPYAPLILRPIQLFLLCYLVFEKVTSLNSELSHANVQMQKDNVVKALLRALSHDLANTTFVISSSIDLAIKQKDKDPAKMLSALERAKVSTKNQSEIIAHAKSVYLNRGEGVLKLQAIDLAECLNKAINSYEVALEKKNLHVVNQVAENKFVVMAEKTSLSFQVIGNIISNAIKFSNSGSGIIARIVKESDSEICLEIRDEGVGMTEDQISKLFSDKENISTRGSSDEIGTGLGLLIISDYMSVYGGSIKVTSRPNEGTSFFLNFKAAKKT